MTTFQFIIINIKEENILKILKRVLQDTILTKSDLPTDEEACIVQKSANGSEKIYFPGNVFYVLVVVSSVTTITRMQKVSPWRRVTQNYVLKYLLYIHRSAYCTEETFLQDF